MTDNKQEKNQINEQEFSTGEDFAKLFNEKYGDSGNFESYVTKGTIVDISKEFITVDVGLKSEGIIPRREFGDDEINIGDILDVYVDRYETTDGTVILSREKARREDVWRKLEKVAADRKIIKGTLIERVKGGFSVDVDGMVAFMPGSQVDIKPIKDLNALVGKDMDVIVINMDKVRMNIIVSHRAILEGERQKQRAEIIKSIKVGDVMDGIVKNITDYGVFIDLGGVDGLLHITDISWNRVSNPNTILSIGQTVKVKVINYDEETQRVSLGMKQLENDPWEGIQGKFKVGEMYKGTVTNITDYGAFVELDKGVEGLIHVSELSWTKKNAHPGKILSVSEEVKVMILEMDKDKRRISLGLKQCEANPWEKFSKDHKIGDIVEGEIKNITEFGFFVEFENEISGMVHLSDLSWDKDGEEVIKSYTKGQKVKVKILDTDIEKERISLGIKQLVEGKVEGALSKYKKNDVVTSVIKEVTNDGLKVEVGDVVGFIKKFDLSIDKIDQNSERFAVGEKVDAKVLSVDKKTNELSLSIKALEIAEEKEAVKRYGSVETGAVLGDILGVAMEEAKAKKTKK